MHPPPLSILFITDVLEKIGGAERNLVTVAEGLASRGHRALICSLHGSAVGHREQTGAVLIERLGLERIYGLKGLKSLIKMARFAIRENVSVIVTYHESSDYLGVLLSFLTRLPVVSNRRDMGFKLKPRHIWMYRLVNRFIDHVVAVSSAVEKLIVDSQWLNPSHITVIPNGVAVSSNLQHSDSPTHLGSPGGEGDGVIDDECVNIFCLANVRPIKGQEYLIEAARTIVNEFPSVRFWLIGDHGADKSYHDRLTERIRELGLEAAVAFTGQIKTDRIMPLLRIMDISVLPSLSEGMSNTLLESMAAGKPVVATDVGGNPEVVEDGKTGYLVPPADPDSLAEALRKLLQDPELRIAMGERAQSRVASEFGVQRMIDAYEEILQQVCMRKNGEILAPRSEPGTKSFISEWR